MNHQLIVLATAWLIGQLHSPPVMATQKSDLSPTVYVLDHDVLDDLENHGFGLAQTLANEKNQSSTTSELYATHASYRSFADVIGRPLKHDEVADQLPKSIPPGSGDVPEMVRLLRGFEDKGKRSDKDLKGGYVIRQVSNNSQHPYMVERDGDEPRHFDTRWLNSKFSRFKLVAIANRMDRSDITGGACGEVRFVYRLVYQTKTASSSLPFFVNVVHQYPDVPAESVGKSPAESASKKSCAEYARSWLLATVDAKSLKAGPLKDLKFKQLEVNFQALRFTSGYMHDFGGQAMYMQRVFRVNGDKLEPAALENTPDVEALERDPKLLAKFLAVLNKPETLRALDQGVLNLDVAPNYLAKFSISWSTLGRARRGNRPYATLFKDRRKMIESIDISSLEYIKSHDALIERLDNLTCMGCHQSGGTAGFHMLGKAHPKFSHSFSRQEVALSPHALAEVSRRKAWVAAVAENKKPSVFRPHSSFPAANWQVLNGNGTSRIPKFDALQTGQLCLVDEKSFSARPICGDRWERAVECRRTVSNQNFEVPLGECVLKEAKSAAGAVCWQGQINETSIANAKSKSNERTPAYNFFAFTDKFKLASSMVTEKKEYSCVLPQSGAPLGRMSRPCSLAEENLSIDFKEMPAEVCANQGGSGFDMCAASGDAGACLETKVARAMLDACSEERPCREDYICQRFPEYHKISKTDYARKKGKKLINLSNPEKILGASIENFHERGIGFCVPTYFLFNMRVDGHPSPVTGLPPGQPKYDRKQPLRGYE